MLPFLLTALLASGAADAASTHRAIRYHDAMEANPILPASPWAIDGVIAGGSLYSALAVRSLWHGGHHKKAILVTAIIVTAHSAAAYHNFQVSRR